MGEHFLLLLQLYVRPARAMSGILDRGNWLFGVIAAVALSFAFSFMVTPAVPHIPHIPHSPRAIAAPPPPPAAALQSAVLSATTALTVFCIFVPLAIGFVTAFGAVRGYFTTVLSRDFAPVLACCSLAWIAAIIPYAIAVQAGGVAQWQISVAALPPSTS